MRVTMATGMQLEITMEMVSDACYSLLSLRNLLWKLFLLVFIIGIIWYYLFSIFLTYVGYWRRTVSLVLVNISWDNGLLLDVTKPLPDTMLTYCQLDP